MRYTNFYKLSGLTLLLIIFLGATTSSARSLLDQPIVEKYSLRDDEVLKYDVKIKGITAGTQIMQVDGRLRLNGHEVYRIISVSKARKLFNVFYPFSNQSESFISRSNFHPLYYQKKIRDGGYEGSTFVNFDPTNQMARIVRNQKLTELHVQPGIQDELSAIYLLRAKKMQVGRKYEFPALVGTKSINASVEVVGIEKIETVLGTLKTIVVKTTLRDLTVWLTNDNARIPVKIEANTKLGKLVSNLKEIS